MALDQTLLRDMARQYALTPAEIDLLRTWIDAGAAWPVVKSAAVPTR